MKKSLWWIIGIVAVVVVTAYFVWLRLPVPNVR
ncbi:Mg2+ and Co2+ transporter CorA [Paenibacillus sp. V4I3]|nr:Mg2+ and Co2+ transporter CorA [Paenibacillus sp. V4I3]